MTKRLVWGYIINMITLAQQLLATATSLLLLVQSNPNVDYSTRQYAINTANNAIAYATQVINQNGYNNYNNYYTTSIKIPYIAKYQSGYGYSQTSCGDMVVFLAKNVYSNGNESSLNAAFRELFSNKNLWVQDYSLSQYYWNNNWNYGGYNCPNDYSYGGYNCGTDTYGNYTCSYPSTCNYDNYNYYNNYNYSNYYGYGVYNPVARFTNLRFERATIESGTAHIYLRGDFTGASSGCEGTRAQTQIIETARQFNGVYNVDIHLSN